MGNHPKARFTDKYLGLDNSPCPKQGKKLSTRNWFDFAVKNNQGSFLEYLARDPEFKRNPITFSVSQRPE